MTTDLFAIDFFCGAGGLTRGFLNVGIQVILGIDSDSNCRITYESNNSPAKFLCSDIRDLDPEDISKYIKDIPRNQIIFAGCAPCQPFTKQRSKTKYPEQRTLLSEFARFVKAFKPGHVFVENVPGIRKAVEKESPYREFIELLDDLKYNFLDGVVDAKNYSVPQTRRRLILLASRFRKMEMPQPTHGSGLLPYPTVREAIAGYAPIKAGETHPKIPNHRASDLSPINLKRITNTSPNGGDRRDWPPDLRLECHKNGYNGHTDVYGRMWWDKPAPALTSRCNSLSNGRYGHPKQNRAISLREAAKLQSFDDSYIFHASSINHMALQIGNAVPVKLAEAVGKAFYVNNGKLS